MAKKQKNLLAISLFISVLLHLSFFLFKAPPAPKNVPAIKKKAVRIILQKKGKTKKQVVDTENSRTKVPPPKRSFWGKENQHFAKESVARRVAPFKEGGQGARQRKKKISLTDLSADKINSPLNKREVASVGKKKGLSQNNDFVEDVPMGDVTNLNTVRYKYYGFFHRIKTKLEQYWGKSLQEKARGLYRRGKKISPNSIKITSLQISLDNKGHIIKIFVKGSSGVQEFDDAAVESFNNAGPFPNPPAGMIKNNVALIEWGFVVKG